MRYGSHPGIREFFYNTTVELTFGGFQKWWYPKIDGLEVYRMENETINR